MSLWFVSTLQPVYSNSKSALLRQQNANANGKSSEFKAAAVVVTFANPDPWIQKQIHVF